MFADAWTDLYSAILRKKTASLLGRLPNSSNNYNKLLKMNANNLEGPLMWYLVDCTGSKFKIV